MEILVLLSFYHDMGTLKVRPDEEELGGSRYCAGSDSRQDREENRGYSWGEIRRPELHEGEESSGEGEMEACPKQKHK